MIIKQKYTQNFGLSVFLILKSKPHDFLKTVCSIELQFSEIVERVIEITNMKFQSILVTFSLEVKAENFGK